MSHPGDQPPLNQRRDITASDRRILQMFIVRAVAAQIESSRAIASLAACIGLPESQDERVQRLVEDVTAALPADPHRPTLYSHIDKAIVDLFVDEFLPQFATKETP